MTSSAAASSRARDELPHEHFVQFYDDDAVLAEAVVAHVMSALQCGGAAILIANKTHGAAFANGLARAGHNLEALRAEGRLVELNASEALGRFMRDGWPDPALFQEVVGGLVAQTLARAPTPRLAAYGEMVAVLCAEGNHAAAVQLESLWNQLGERHSFALFCAYPLSVFAGEGHDKTLASVCAAHGRTVPTEAHTALGSIKARNDHVIELQRRGLEVDRERTRRLEAEEALLRRERELTELLDSIQDGVLDIAPDGRVSAANRAYLTLLNSSARDYVGRDIRLSLAPAGLFDRIWARLVRGDVVRAELAEITSQEGQVHRVSIQRAMLRMTGRTLHMRWFLQLLRS